MLISENIIGTVTAALLEPWFIGLFVAAFAATSMIRYSKNFTRDWSGRVLVRRGQSRRKQIRFTDMLWPWRGAGLAASDISTQPASGARPIKYQRWENSCNADTAIAGARQWQRLSDIIGSAGDGFDRADSAHRAAKIQLDVAELSFNRLLAEMSKVMPLPVEPSRPGGSHGDHQRSPAALEAIAA